MKGTITILFCLIASVTASQAGEIDYECIIKHVYRLNDDGQLIISGFNNYFVGDRFVVSRKTGAITGETLTTILSKRTQVINFGGNENSYKAIASFEGQFQLIEVQEFRDGEMKPFVASSIGGSGIVTGICK